MNARVEPVTAARADDWCRLRTALWSGRGDGHHRREIERFFAGELAEPAAVFLAWVDGAAIGLVELSIRAYAEGCYHPRPAYVEGIYVEPAHRGAGVAQQLLTAADAWARARGCRELASDSAPDNAASGAMHTRAGFRDIGLVRCWAKRLD